MVYLPHWPNFLKNQPSYDLVKLLKILKNLDNPQDKVPPTIHIAGTNGKGSTSAFLASILQNSGYKAHIYTSPHIKYCNERIVIANNQIDDNYLYQILEEIRVNSQEEILTLHEALTIAAILAFSRNKANICIVETGMGGRIDPTNVINNKIATIITPISYDHEEFLGNTLSAIAAEKSHIMRKNTPCIVAHQANDAGKIIELRSLEISTPLIHLNQEFNVEINKDESFDFQYCGKNISESFCNLTKPALQGNHQYLNASLAIATLLALKDFKMADFNISKDQINQGLEKVRWPYRLEKINNFNRLLSHEESEVIIDGAHNNSGFKALLQWLKEEIIQDYENDSLKRNFLIVGFSKNKVKKEFFDGFQGIVDFVCAVKVNGEPNPEKKEVILDKIKESGFDNATCQDSLTDSINFLTNLDQTNPCRIVICGSLYLARDIAT